MQHDRLFPHCTVHRLFPHAERDAVNAALDAIAPAAPVVGYLRKS
jgi:hypothetical protein